MDVWVAEHLRCVVSELNLLLCSLSSACTAQSCPAMTATKDWEFLCATHGSQPRKVQAHSSRHPLHTHYTRYPSTLTAQPLMRCV